MRGDSRFLWRHATASLRDAMLITARDQARVLDAAWPENTTDERRDEERDWVGSAPMAADTIDSTS